jgi:hypothetical protein
MAPAFNKLFITRDQKCFNETAMIGEGGNYLDPAALSDSIMRVLRRYKNTQTNLESKAARIRITREILEDVSK